ncbi:MAG: hypothetical protein JW874_06305 [Spirochaetales bacterium]|nr:hypothetical protein [Spirochaetales bacterium]
MEHILSLFTDSRMKSSITLNTRRIEEIGQYLYFRFLRKRLIPEDMCSELYEGVVEHLKSYREKNPEEKKVKRAYVTTSANWLASKLRRKNRNQESRETAVMEILKNELDALGSTKPCRLSRRYEKRILDAIGNLLEAGKCKRRHVLFYILFHCYNSRPEFTVRLLKTAGLKTGQNIRRIKQVRRHVERKSLKQREALLKKIESKYSHVIKTQYEISRLTDTCLFDEVNLKKSELKKLTEERKKVFAKLANIRLVPPVEYLASMLNVPWSTVEYGIKRVEKLILKHVKEKEAAA